MSDLSKIKPKISYSSDKSHIIRDFYNPCMAQSCLYRRAVGYFSSTGLALAAQGIILLLENGGRIQLIASPVLTEEDTLAINEGYKKREDVVLEALQRELKDIENKIIKDRLSALAWLIASNSLEIKLAIRVDTNKRIKRGLFHEKMGIFSDSHGNNVAFSGSSNETAGGLIENFEAIDVYWSWEDPAGRVIDKIARFDSFWNDNTTGLSVVDYTNVTSDLLSEYKTIYIPKTDIDYTYQAKEDSPPYELENDLGPHIPSDIELRDYQKAVINNWFKAKGKGVVQLATGTGKTITALSAAVTLFQKVNLELLIVVCPYRHLVTQWDEEACKFGLKPMLAFASSKKWIPVIDRFLAYGFQDDKTLPVIITTIATFAKEKFQVRLNRLPKKTFIIGDEVHNFGAKRISKGLPVNVPWRMGLSATPERWFDTLGTQEILKYFGEVVEPKVTLKEALHWGVLTPYYYHPILVELSDEEYEIYLELTEKVGKMFAMGESIDDEESPLQSLLIQRARLIAKAENKIVELEKLMKPWEDPSHLLVYCGDGSVDSDIDDESIRHIDQVTQLVGNELGLKVSKYTSETTLEDRENLKSLIASGELQGLIAIRCLDEGVDIPSIKTAIILASSANPKQFIQRRGRVLRRAPGKECAKIYDMIVIPPPGFEVSEVERKMVKKEISRFIEFADLAKNSARARSILLEVQKRYSLLDM